MLAISAAETPCSPSAVARGASMCSVRAVADVASIGAPVLSMPSGPRPASSAPTQPARAPVPHNAANTASRRGLFTPRPPQVSPRSNGGFQSSVDDDCKPYRAATSRTARIIPGNSALTTATTAGAITITILSPSSCPRRAIQLATNSLANGRRAMMAGYRRKS